MTWLVWRQHRGEALIASIGLCSLAAVLIITGIQIAASFQSLAWRRASRTHNSPTATRSRERSRSPTGF
jgi:hypothetical protein